MSAYRLTWLPIESCGNCGAKDGKGHLVRLGNRMAVAMWNGERFIYPATYGAQLDFEPSHYYLPGAGHA